MKKILYVLIPFFLVVSCGKQAEKPAKTSEFIQMQQSFNETLLLVQEFTQKNTMRVDGTNVYSWVSHQKKDLSYPIIKLYIDKNFEVNGNVERVLSIEKMSSEDEWDKVEYSIYPSRGNYYLHIMRYDQHKAESVKVIIQDLKKMQVVLKPFLKRLEEAKEDYQKKTYISYEKFQKIAHEI